MDLENLIKSQNKIIEEVRSGEYRKKKEEERMIKKQMSNKQVVDMIREDYILGYSKKELSAKHKIELGRIVKAIDTLKKDPAVISAMEDRIEQIANSSDDKKAAAPVETEKVEEVQDNNSVTETTVEVGSNVYKKGGKLTDDAKLMIAEEFESGINRAELARKFGVGRETVSRVINELVPPEKIKEINKRIMQDTAKNARDHKEDNKKMSNSDLEKEIIKKIDSSFNISKKPEVAVEEKKPEVVEQIKDVEVVSAPAPIKDSEYDSVKSVVENTEFVQTYSNQSGIGSADPSMMFPVGNITEHLVEVKKNDYLTVGLINNRHNMGVNTYIFDVICQDEIFDFDYLENHVKEFINTNIPFKNGIPQQGLLVKTTGLQTAIMALTKVCYNMKINLIIAHHQISKGVDQKYRNQPIFTDFPIASDTPYVLTHIGGTVGKMFLFESKPVEFTNVSSFYEICIINRDNKHRNSSKPEFAAPISTYSIICKNMNSMIMCSIMLQKLFSTDRSFYRTMKINEYSANAKNSIGYKFNTIQRSYF